MDNFTHSLAGWALGQTGLKRKSRKGLAALILGANAPDIDVFFGWVPWVPLATHRGVTHSLVAGFLVLPILLAVLLWLLDRWQAKRGQTFNSGLEMRFGWLLALAYLGCLTHPLLDWQTSYAVQLFSPFTDLWFHNDSLFIIDVWVWSGLALAIWLSRRREKRGEGDWRRPAIVALGVVVLYISVNGVVSGFARNAMRFGAPYTEAEIVVVSPPPVLFWKRDVIWRESGGYREEEIGWRERLIGTGVYDPFYSEISLQSFTEPVPDGMDDPLVRRVLANDPKLATFGRWSILPMAAVERSRCTVRIAFDDARFAMNPIRGPLSQSITLPTGAPNCTT